MQEDSGGLFLGTKAHVATVWFVPSGMVLSAQEQLAEQLIGLSCRSNFHQ